VGHDCNGCGVPGNADRRARVFVEMTVIYGLIAKGNHLCCGGGYLRTCDRLFTASSEAEKYIPTFKERCLKEADRDTLHISVAGFELWGQV
jgi:hypothetical protein